MFTGAGHGDEPPTPQSLLKEHGLQSAGSFFVVDAEQEALQKFYNMDPLMRKMKGEFYEWAAILQNEYEYNTLGEYRIYLTGHLNDVGQAIGQMPQRNPLERQQVLNMRAYQQSVDNELRVTNSQIAIRERKLVGEEGKEKAEEEFKESRKVFLSAASEARPYYDRVVAEYAKLSEDSAVKNALKAHNQMMKVHMKLGPSDKLKKAAGTVVKHERDYSPETAARRQRMPKHKLKAKSRANRN